MVFSMSNCCFGMSHSSSVERRSFGAVRHHADELSEQTFGDAIEGRIDGPDFRDADVVQIAGHRFCGSRPLQRSGD